MKNCCRIILLMICLYSLHGYGSTTCQMTPYGEYCLSEVDFQSFSQSAYQNQYQSQWCWAASISMIFTFNQHPVAQDRIVSEVYGSAVNMPAMYGYHISSQLNREWYDDYGIPFRSQVTGLYDESAGIYGITNEDIVNNLDNGNPLVIGARSHAMVLTVVGYYRTPYGPNIVEAGVFDPWPGNGARGLEADELVPVSQGGSLRYLASVQIIGVDEGGFDGPGENTEDDSGGGVMSFQFVFIALMLSLYRLGIRRRNFNVASW